MLKIGVLASREGTTLQSVLDACADRRIDGQIAIVVSNNSGSGALRRARHADVATAHLSSTTHPVPSALDTAIRDALVGAAVDLVLLAGYMKKLGPLTIAAFNDRILNMHPALLPKFGGHGMYGDRVFEAVLEAGEMESGVSMHLVTADFDAGRVVRQCTVPVIPGDTTETLKARVQARERTFIVETLGEIARGELVLGSTKE